MRASLNESAFAPDRWVIWIEGAPQTICFAGGRLHIGPLNTQRLGAAESDSPWIRSGWRDALVVRTLAAKTENGFSQRNLPLVAGLPDASLDLEGLIHRRRTPTSFDNEPVSKEDLERILSRIELADSRATTGLFAICRNVSSVAPSIYAVENGALGHQLCAASASDPWSSFFPGSRGRDVSNAAVALLVVSGPPRWNPVSASDYEQIWMNVGFISQQIVWHANAHRLSALPTVGLRDKEIRSLIKVDEALTATECVFLGHSGERP